MRFGRIISSVDHLFQEPPPYDSVVTAGGVFLTRLDYRDDYARFRVPDTDCPLLPRPSEPLDSGVQDESEPARWLVYGSPDTRNDWKLRGQPTNADRIQLSYAVFPSTFTVQFDVNLLGYGAPFSASTAHGIGIELKVDNNNWVRIGHGYVRWYDYPEPYLPARVLSRRLSGVEENFASQYGYGAVLVQVERTSVGLVRARYSSDGGQTWTTWLDIGTLSGELTFSVCGFTCYPVTPDVWVNASSGGAGYVDAKVTSVTTLSGAPSSVTVTTPVVVTGEPLKVEISRLPAIGFLEWRASNTPFGRDDNLPSWDRPVGEYRYWQARVTWTERNRLLERIEFRDASSRISIIEWAGFGWLLHHAGMTPPYRPKEKPLGGVPRSVEIAGDSVDWYDADDEYITTRDK